MAIGVLTKKRSGWSVQRTLQPSECRAACMTQGGRERLEDRSGKPCRVTEVLPEERTAICAFALPYPKIGYRKLMGMRVDAGVACVGESTVYRVLSEADLLSRGKRSSQSSRSTISGRPDQTRNGTRT